MQLGIFAKTFPGSDPSSVFTAVKSAGYQTVQFNMACCGLGAMPDDIPPHSSAAIRRAAEESGIAIAALSATYNMIHPLTDERARGHGRLGVAAKAANEAGISMLTLCTGTRNPDDQWAHHAQNSTRGAWRDLLHSMEIALQYAEQYNLTLGIEPELANVVSSAEKAKQLITELGSARAKIVLDAANLFEHTPINEQRNCVASSVELLAEHIIMAHAKDRDANGAFVAAGKGVLDYGHYLSCLRRVGFDGPLVTHGLSPAEAPDVATFLRDRL